jgi:hypothetical protein
MIPINNININTSFILGEKALLTCLFIARTITTKDENCEEFINCVDKGSNIIEWELMKKLGSKAICISMDRVCHSE